MTAQTEFDNPQAQLAAATKRVRDRTRLTLGLLVAALGYLAFSWHAMDIGGILEKSDPSKGGVLVRDSVAYKTHVVRDLRGDGWLVAIEGDQRSPYKTLPEWVTVANGEGRIDLGDGVVVEVSDTRVAFDWPGYGPVVATLDGRNLSVDLPDRVFAEEQPFEEARIEALIEKEREGVRRLAAREFEKSVEEYGAFAWAAASIQNWINGYFAEDIVVSDAKIEEIRARFEKRVNTPNLSFNGRQLDVKLAWDKRVRIIAGSKIEIHKFSYGWENFWFAFNSPLTGLSTGELIDAAWTDSPRFDPAIPNGAFIFDAFWNNPDWRHGYVINAVFETLLMAFVGTFFAAFFALPLAFFAAKNFTPFRFPLSLGLFTALAPVRFITRRFFDFLRGVDMLLWALIFTRAFGLGPLTGALAITFTDTGTLGKLFSEALENVDNKQIEGVKATGARQLQRYRFGVIPQIMPIFISQTLYYFESNIRSATVIGALGAGGIGLILRETVNTQQDWENVLLIIVLTILLVVMVDLISGWLRRRLIAGGARRASITSAIMAGLAGAATATLFGFEFLGAYWWLFALGSTIVFIGLAVWTLLLIANAPRNDPAQARAKAAQLA